MTSFKTRESRSLVSIGDISRETVGTVLKFDYASENTFESVAR